MLLQNGESGFLGMVEHNRSFEVIRATWCILAGSSESFKDSRGSRRNTLETLRFPFLDSRERQQIFKALTGFQSRPVLRSVKLFVKLPTSLRNPTANQRSRQNESNARASIKYGRTRPIDTSTYPVFRIAGARTIPHRRKIHSSKYYLALPSS